jgi:tRNA pseudouridine38-40 synthase
MARFKLTVEYDGTPFVGWQRQGIGESVQSVIEDAVFALSAERITLRGAGRTDAGVHATGQVAHLDLAREWPPEVLRDALNAHIRPHPVSILAAERVDDRFDSRFWAIGRRYFYKIVDRRAPLALERDRAWHTHKGLDADAMDRAAKRLLGHHDFTTFRAAHCQAKSPMKTLERLDVIRDGDRIEIHAAARSFLHNQVRSMVGSLQMVGAGRWTADDLTAALEARDRARCGPVAPAGGLYLTAVIYPASEDDTAIESDGLSGDTD